MATPTYTAIASITLSSSASSVEFSSIPQDYRDLVLVWDLDADSTSGAVNIVLNSDTGANYSRVQMRGDGSSASSVSGSGDNEIRAYSSPYDKFWGQMSLMDYSATDKHKTALIRQNNVGEYVTALAARYASTSAITTLEVQVNTGNYETGSTLALYGIAS